MKKLIICLIILAAVAGFAFGQTEDFTAPVGEPDASSIGSDEAQLELQQITISDCEEAAFWVASMAQDEGLITIRTLEGNPLEKETKDSVRIAEERKIRSDDGWLGDNVIGVKVSFYRRGNNVFSVLPIKPIPIAGTTKIISLWVVGRNYNHELKIIVADFYGNKAELSVGKLNFSGWRKLSVAIPPQITQSDFHYTAKEGLKFVGLKVECNPEEAFGTYYLYFDDISAETDLFSLKVRDADDMDDGW